MRTTILALTILGLAATTTYAQEVKGALGFEMKSIEGKDVKLSQYKGKVVLFVNVASKCGLTPQYDGLQALYEKYKDQGLVIIGVPANEFGKQEPGTDSEIATFCSTKYHVTFPMLSKVVVKGTNIAPLYQFLTSKETNPKFAGEIGWNFTKFLIGRNGDVVARFEPNIAPDSDAIKSAIEKELAHK